MSHDGRDGRERKKIEQDFPRKGVSYWNSARNSVAVVNSRFRSSSSREYERNVERRDIGRENFFQVFPNLFQSNSKFSIMFVYMYIYIFFHFFLFIEEYTE